MEIQKIKDHDNEGGMTLDECSALIEKGVQVLTNVEMDAIVMDDAKRKKYYAFLPAWTSTHISYKGAKCVVRERGKTYHFTIPDEDERRFEESCTEKKV